MLALASFAGCITVDSPTPGKPLAIRADTVLVFGRVRVFSSGVEYRPWNPSEVVGPQLYVALLRLGPRRIAPGPPFEEDGRFYWRLPPGDYAVIGNSHDVYAERTSYSQVQDMVVLALLRVPAGVPAVYAGELSLELDSVKPPRLRRSSFEFGSEQVRDRQDEALAELEQRFGPLPEDPSILLMCSGPSVPEFDDPELFGRGRALLDAGCLAERP